MRNVLNYFFYLQVLQVPQVEEVQLADEGTPFTAKKMPL